MAEKERFELSRRSSRPTPLAGEPLRPLGYFSMPNSRVIISFLTGLSPGFLKVAEREGFEPPVLSHNGFQDRHHRPLGHLSVSAALTYYHISFSLSIIFPIFSRRIIRIKTAILHLHLELLILFRYNIQISFPIYGPFKFIRSRGTPRMEKSFYAEQTHYPRRAGK